VRGISDDKQLHFVKILDLDFAFKDFPWIVVGLGLSFENSALDLDRRYMTVRSALVTKRLQALHTNRDS